jgi:hypothetical protein
MPSQSTSFVHGWPVDATHIKSIHSSPAVQSSVLEQASPADGREMLISDAACALNAHSKKIKIVKPPVIFFITSPP